MDKQDAIDFIVQEFENGRTPSEIARSLSVRMGAPLDVVARFVNRTLEQRVSLIDPPAAAPPAVAPPAKERPPAETPAEPTPVEVPPAQPAAPRREAPNLFQPRAGTPGPAAPVPTIPGLEMPPAPAPGDEIDPRLEKFILDQLGKDRKETDVVMAVCERAAMDWKEAQRVVARVKARHHRKIVSRRNRLLIPFSLGFIAVGLGLGYAGLSELLLLEPFVEALNSGGLAAALEALPPDFSRQSFWALGLGAALIVGGLVGVVQAIRAGLE